MKFHDYYKTLGVAKDATQEQIQKAYRKLARKYHPDANKSAGAQDRFKEVNEAYEVLRDPEKRKKYDTLGQNWKNGQDFTPPPGFEGAFQFGGDGGGSFSDFFEAIFGGMGGFQSAGGRGRTMARKGRDLESSIDLTLDEIVRCGKKHVEFDVVEQGSGGGSVRKRRSLDVTIPAGITGGSRIRLSGQGGQGLGGGPGGDLYLKVRLLPYPPFSVEGQDLLTQVDIPPWKAALGGSVTVRTLEGEASVKIPAGTRGGQTLRLRGKGLPKKNNERGDILVSIRIVTPKQLTPKQKELYEALRDEEQ